MTEQQVKNLHAQLKLIVTYVEDIAVGVDDLEYDDITMTEENKKEVCYGMLGMAYKLGLAVTDLQKQLKVVAK